MSCASSTMLRSSSSTVLPAASFVWGVLAVIAAAEKEGAAAAGGAILAVSGAGNVGLSRVGGRMRGLFDCGTGGATAVAVLVLAVAVVDAAGAAVPASNVCICSCPSSCCTCSSSTTSGAFPFLSTLPPLSSLAAVRIAFVFSTLGTTGLMTLSIASTPLLQISRLSASKPASAPLLIPVRKMLSACSR